MSVRRFARVALAAGVSVSLTTAIAYAAGPGSAGIGDPYFPTYGNGGYDVTSYDIDITYVPAGTTVKGTTTIKATATQDLTRFNLDLLLTASSVTVNGTKAKFAKSDPHELVVTPAATIRKGSSMTVKVVYSGQPRTISYAGVASPWVGSGTESMALGEPEIAAWWFPSNDHPRDKASYNFTFRVPKGLEAIGNGKLVSKTTSGSTDVWKWSMPQPMAPYLAFMAIGQYAVTKGTTAGRPYVVAVSQKLPSGLRSTITKDLMKTPSIINWEATQFGPYPFDIVGGVVPLDDFGYALETQSRPVDTKGFWGGGSNLSVVVHENAHQWFGDSVSVNNWKDIWLNEGFATYATWMYDEAHGGPTTAQRFEAAYASADWSGRVADPGRDHIYDELVYTRGALTLHALRSRIGAPAFGTLLRTWTSTYAGKNATTADFAAMAERVSTKELSAFFTDWLYEEGKPAR